VLDDSIMLVIVVYLYRCFVLEHGELWSYEEILNAWDRGKGRDVFVDSFPLVSHVNIHVIVFYE